ENVALPQSGILRGARRKTHEPVNALEQSGPVVAEAVECTGTDQAFQHALADDARVDAAAEILNALEQLFLALLDNVLDRSIPHALDGCQRIEDTVFTNLEQPVARQNGWRHNLDAEAHCIAAVFVQLVRIRHIVSHR